MPKCNKSTPPVKDTNYVTHEDIRHFIQDRTIEDNEVYMDLFFSDDEISQAKRFASMSFNSTPPYVYTVEPEKMPFNMAYIHGIIYHLYLARLSKLKRNEIEYTAGGVTTTMDKKLIDHLTQDLLFHKQEFDRKTKELKLIINMNRVGSKIG